MFGILGWRRWGRRSKLSLVVDVLELGRHLTCHLFQILLVMTISKFLCIEDKLLFLLSRLEL